jgi:transcriptional regulator with XRE-family HTH domain
MSDSLEGLGHRLAQVCAREGLNQSEFALRIGVTPGFVSDILRGNKKPGCEFLFNLRQSLGVGIDWLLTGKGSMYGGEPIEIGLFQHIVWQIQLVRAALIDEQPAARQLLDSLYQQPDTDTTTFTASDWQASHTSLSLDDLALATVLYNSHLWTQDADQRIRNIHAAVLTHFQVQKPANHLQSLANALRPEQPVQRITQINIGNNIRNSGR